MFENAKQEIENEFFPNKGHGHLRLSVAKNAITQFKKLTNDHVKVVDLMLFYVENGTQFTRRYGDIDGKYYNSMLSMFEKVIIECEKDEQLYNLLSDRLDLIVEESEGIGWGYHDGLYELYDSLSWLYEEVE